MSLGTALRLAVAGTRTDTLRVVLTALSASLAALALLAAATVLSIPTPRVLDEFGGGWYDGNSEQYTSALLREPGLRPGVVIALILLCVPVLALAAQCARLGAPARDRRLAAIRLAGATPRQALAVIAAETGLATVLGSALGLVLFLVGRVALHRRDAAGQLALPTDVLPAAWSFVAICLGLPVAATLLAAVLLRRVRITPFGVVRRARRMRTPRAWPALALLVCLALVGAFAPIRQWADERDWESSGLPGEALVFVLFFVVPLVMSLCVIVGTASISYLIGSALRRWGRGPASLLAGSRLMNDPWQGSRVLAGLLACVLIGGISVGVRAWFVAQREVDAEGSRRWAELTGEPFFADELDDFYVNSMDVVDLAVVVAIGIAVTALLIAVAESIATRRRTYAALVATGVPRAVIGRSILWQALAPAVPAVLLAGVAGYLVTRGIQTEVQSSAGGGTYCAADPAICNDPTVAEQYLREVDMEGLVRAIPVPFEGLGLLTGGALLAVLVAVAVSLLFLRSSTSLEEMRVG